MSNSTISDLKKIIEFSHTQVQYKEPSHLAASHNFYDHAEFLPSPPPQEDEVLTIPAHHSLTDIDLKSSEHSSKQGEAPEFILADILRRNSARVVLQNLLFTDLLVKGSLLAFNLLLFQQKNLDLFNNNSEKY